MNLSFGYNTNGFAHHKLEDALEIIADCGYRGVALTLDNYHCNPFSVEPADLSRLRQLLDKLPATMISLDPSEVGAVDAAGAALRAKEAREREAAAKALEIGVRSLYRYLA